MQNPEIKEKKCKIAFICTGNTCRSPMAQFIMRAKLKQAGVNNVIVRSFGVNAHGTRMKDFAKCALKRLKVGYSDYTSKPIPKNLNTYDAVICMTSEHKRTLTGKCPSLYTFDELFGVGDVPDPYGKGEEDYFSVAQTLDVCCDKLIDFLKRLSDENSNRQ